MKTFAIFVAILASATFVADAPAQTRAPRPVGQSSPPLGGQTLAQKEEQAVEGRTESVDSSRTEITLTDGTKAGSAAGGRVDTRRTRRGHEHRRKLPGCRRGEGSRWTAC